MRVHINTPQASAPEKSGSSENDARDRFHIYWQDGDYYVSIPNYDGGEVVAAEVADKLLRRIARLEADLNECLEFLEGQSDVVDGDYGEPSPNRAMQLCSMIDETLNGRPV